MGYHSSLEGNDGIGMFEAFLFTFVNIFALLNSRYCGRIGWRTSYSQFFQFVNQRSFCIALWSLAETFRCLDLTFCQFHTISHRRQDVTFWLSINPLVVVGRLIIIRWLAVNLQETVKLYYFSLGNKLLRQGFALLAVDGNLNSGLLQFCIRHLAGDSALPDQFI